MKVKSVESNSESKIKDSGVIRVSDKDKDRDRARKRKHIVLIITTLLILVIIFNWQSIPKYSLRIVVSGSMEPEIEVNSINIIKTCKPSKIKVNDIICFRYTKDIIHRVVKITTDSKGQRHFVTKGDANNDVDTIDITEDMLIGKLVYTSTFLNNTKLSEKSLSRVDKDTLSLLIIGIGFVVIIVLNLLSYIINIITIALNKQKREEIKRAYNIELNKLAIESRNEVEEIENTVEHRFEFLIMQIEKLLIYNELNTMRHQLKKHQRKLKRISKLREISKKLDDATTENLSKQ